MKDNSLRRANTGFTLVELLVSVAIGLFLVTVVGGVYLSSKDSFNYQDAMSRLQENSRFAMERMARDIRMAGYTGCGNLSKVANIVTNSPTKVWLDFLTPVFGYNDLLAAPTHFPNAVLGTDAIVLIGVGQGEELSVFSHTPPTIQTNRVHSIQRGAILLVTDCSQTSVFQMSGPANTSFNAVTVEHNTGSVTPGNCVTGLKASCPGSATGYSFKPGSSLLQVYANGYYVRPSATPNNGNALWVCSITLTPVSNPNTATWPCTELINGVEDMQITYGVDTDGDTSANQYVTANNVGNWAQVVSVRVSLLMATPPSAGRLSANPQTYTYNGTTTTATDRRVRHVYSSTVNVRNRTK